MNNDKIIDEILKYSDEGGWKSIKYVITGLGCIRGRRCGRGEKEVNGGEIAHLDPPSVRSFAQVP